MTDELTVMSAYVPISSGVNVRVRPDTLGDINSIVSLMRRDADGTETRIKSVLYPVREGSMVRFGKGVPERVRMLGPDDPSWWFWMQCWFVEVDGRRILEVAEHETWPPVPPAPPIPLRRRIARRSRAAADAVAKQLGYTRTGHCDCGDDY